MEIVESVLGATCDVVGRMANGRSLFDAAMVLKPDLIVTDISMPVLNGIEAANQLHEAGCTSKIIFLTVHSDPDFLTTCLATGARGYVIKARTAIDLIPAIREVLAGRIFISPPFMHR
jgi:DNA-binding NarL/FixJ family response regulator